MNKQSCSIYLPASAFLCRPVLVRYVVRDLLGQGTFGQVFKCVPTDDGAAAAGEDGEDCLGDDGAIAIKVGGS